MWPLLLLSVLTAEPFWEAKAPTDWSDEEVQAVLSQSPWAQMHEVSIAQNQRRAPAVHFYLASAYPMAAAEQEFRRRNPPAGRALESSQDSEYREFLKDNAGRYIVLAVRVDRPELLSKPKSLRRMEEDSVLRIGNRKYELVGHFPPDRTGGDPYLRLIFSRDLRPGDKTLEFDLYLPGVALPFRNVKFDLDGLRYKGKPEL